MKRIICLTLICSLILFTIPAISFANKDQENNTKCETLRDKINNDCESKKWKDMTKKEKKQEIKERIILGSATLFFSMVLVGATNAILGENSKGGDE